MPPLAGSRHSFTQGVRDAAGRPFMTSRARCSASWRRSTEPAIEHLTSYVTSLQYMNELDQEFDDDEPLKVRVGNMRLFLRVLLKDGAITLQPMPTSEPTSLTSCSCRSPRSLAHKRRTPRG